MIVYSATNKVTGKRYIGATGKSLAERRGQHWLTARTVGSTVFHKALLEYGIDAFSWAPLFHAEDRELALLAEMEAIRVFKTMDRDFGYNDSAGGQGPLGRKQPQEEKDRRAATQRGKIRTVKVPITDIDVIAKRKASGESFRKIARDYGVRAETIFYFLKRHAERVNACG